jgi:cyclic pyranopterin phosphate synthase
VQRSASIATLCWQVAELMSDTIEKPLPVEFSHLTDDGRASMVDVSGKPVTRRVAAASCLVRLQASTVERLSDLPKGDAWAVARLAGIQAAKRTSELIPLAHPLPIDQIEVELAAVDEGVEIRARVVTTARTGAELEALVACSTAALGLYDMVKSVDRGAVVTDLKLDAKSGGASGDYVRER